MGTASVDFGSRLRAWRLHLRRSQAEIERRAGLAHNAISRIENGDVHPRLGTLERIAEALEISVEQLQFRLPPAGSRAEVPKDLPEDVRGLLGAIAELPADRRAEVVSLLCQIVGQVNQ